MITHRKNSNAGKRDNSRKSIKRLCNKTHEICDNIYVPFALLFSSVSNICPYFPSTIYRKGRKTQRHTMTPENWLEYPNVNSRKQNNSRVAGGGHSTACQEKKHWTAHTDGEWMMWKTEEKILSFSLFVSQFPFMSDFWYFFFSFPPRSFYTESPHHHVVLKKSALNSRTTQ